MGRGIGKRKNAIKMQMLGPLQKYARQLEAENAALKGDPNTVIGQFIGNYRELYSQNARLSALAAALIKKLGGSVPLPRAEMESFSRQRINISWNLPDGQTEETADEFVFTYDVADAPHGSPVAHTEPPGAPPPGEGPAQGGKCPVCYVQYFQRNVRTPPTPHGALLRGSGGPF